MVNELEIMRQDLDVCYNYVKTCKFCGLEYGTDNRGEQRKDTCPVCELSDFTLVKRVVKRKKEKGI